jgi:ELWxxDGT repeat protein
MNTSFWHRWCHSLRRAKRTDRVSRAKPRWLPFLEALEDRVTPSLMPQMVLDINTNSLSANPAQLVAVGSATYFTADDGVHGIELWKSDGTAAGTTLVKDLFPGAYRQYDSTGAWSYVPNSSNPRELTNVNGTLFFTTYDSTHGYELWKSNGTSAGTVLLKDIYPNSAVPISNDLTAVNGTLFFTAYDNLNGWELWKSDGTAAGTVLVKDINPGSNGSAPSNLTNVNGRLFFTAWDVSKDLYELWRSNGTAAGTALVQDVFPATSNAYFGSLTNVNGTLLFTIGDNSHPMELWRSDGTPAGTVLVKGFSNLRGPYSSLTQVNGTLFFTADDGAHGWELWRSDGTTAGSALVKDINPGSAWSYPRYLTNVNGALFYSADDGTHGRELWKSDGTAAGTTLVRDLYSGGSTDNYGNYSLNNSNPRNLTNVNGTLCFTAYDSNGPELWKSDGTVAGTVPVSPSGGTANNLTNANGTLYFADSDGTHGMELWKSDGTAAGTTLVKDINTHTASADPRSLTPGSMANVNGTLFFAANDGLHGPVLWKSDGTAAGTVLVSALAWYPGNLTNVNGTLFFTVSTGSTGGELWKSDGTATGTVPVSSLGLRASNLTNVNGTLIFTADNGSSGWELWKSDGTAAGTALVKDIFPGGSIDNYAGYSLNSSSPSNLTNVNGTLFFTANDGTHGYELWKSDGTAAGTTLVKDIRLGSNQYYLPPAYLSDVNGTLFFTANDGTHGRELWKSDGTAAGTVLVKDINPGGAGSSPRYLTNMNGMLLFTANDGTTGWELWKSDGTAAGTTLVKDINPASASSSASYLTNVNGTLFFSANNATTGLELWKSDGTAAGTVLVRNINPGSIGSNPSYLTNVNDTLFFTANDGAHGTELWKSDGTTTGTTLVEDIYPGTYSFTPPKYLLAVNGTLFFTANDGIHGTELWVLVDSTTQGTSLAANGFPATITAGIAGSFTITAQNANGSINTGYRGTVHFSSSDPQAVLPADYTFTAADQGVHTFSATLRTAGTQSIGVTDTVNGLLASVQTGIVVTPNVVTHFNVALFPSPQHAGVTGAFRIIARDAYNNTVPSYTGTVHFSTSDTAKGARLPANYTFTTADKGIRTFYATLFTAGTQSLTATDTVTSSIAGSQTGIVITPAALHQFRVYGFPNPTIAGAAHTVSVQAKDLYGNTVTGYTGIIAFTSSDSQAIIPSSYTFTAADAGTHTFSATLNTVGKQSLTVKDQADPTKTGTQANITVNPAGAARFLGGGPPGGGTVESTMPARTVAGAPLRKATVVDPGESAYALRRRATDALFVALSLESN